MLLQYDVRWCVGFTFVMYGIQWFKMASKQVELKNKSRTANPAADMAGLLWGAEVGGNGGHLKYLEVTF